MTDQSKARNRRPGIPVIPAIIVVFAVVSCSVYANLSHLVKNPVNYKYFPPFKPYVNGNHNKHLGAEYLNIAKSIAKGEGFSNPFGEETGPTAWMPPVLPAILATVLVLTGNNIDVLMWVVVVLQNLSLIATGLLIVTLGRQTSKRIGSGVGVVIFLVFLWTHFRLCFQNTHDCWLVLLTIDALIAGLCWGRPLRSWHRAVGWGFFGGLCALISPIVGLTWGLLSCAVALGQRNRWPLAVAALCSILAVTPWTIRNYLVLGRWMPVKSNAMYEFYQSQCLQPDGLLQARTFGTHPYSRPNKARYDYKMMGELPFIDAKAEIFWKAVKANPVDFLDRVALRFLGATLWYVPLNRVEGPKQLWMFWPNRITHPFAFVALLILVYSSFWRPLEREQWVVIGVYACYLLPYIIVSYYDRYVMPLLAVKALLIVWAVDRLMWLLPPPKKKRKKKRPASIPKTSQRTKQRKVSDVVSLQHSPEISRKGN